MTLPLSDRLDRANAKVAAISAKITALAGSRASLEAALGAAILERNRLQAATDTIAAQEAAAAAKEAARHERHMADLARMDAEARRLHPTMFES